GERITAAGQWAFGRVYSAQVGHRALNQHFLRVVQLDLTGRAADRRGQDVALAQVDGVVVDVGVAGGDGDVVFTLGVDASYATGVERSLRVRTERLDRDVIGAVSGDAELEEAVVAVPVVVIAGKQGAVGVVDLNGRVEPTHPAVRRGDVDREGGARPGGDRVEVEVTGAGARTAVRSVADVTAGPDAGSLRFDSGVAGQRNGPVVLLVGVDRLRVDLCRRELPQDA